MSYFDIVDEVDVLICRWEGNLCPDCGAPIKSDIFFNRCSEKPNEHSLGDAVSYLKKIKEVIEKECPI